MYYAQETSAKLEGGNHKSLIREKYLPLICVVTHVQALLRHQWQAPRFFARYLICIPVILAYCYLVSHWAPDLCLFFLEYSHTQSQLSTNARQPRKGTSGNFLVRAE